MSEPRDTANPFVGPHPFEAGRRIFGRDKEIDHLYYLLSAERIVLLYSPSGAGKSSLIQAGLLQRLAGRFDVWGPVRVKDPAEQGNRYVRSVMLGFEQPLPEARRRTSEQLATMTLEEYAASRPRKRSAPQNVLLIFDQFEEILTADPLAVEVKREFFDQLGALLQNPRYWALFALREDYLAPLDPYAERVPTHLKNRFRLDLLNLDGARQAIAGPAPEGGRTFTLEAVDKLVIDLATVKVQQPDGRFREQTGLHVEPVQLQVVCRRLWDKMPPQKKLIEVDDIQGSGDVKQALSAYYGDVVDKIANGDVKLENGVREWVGEKLITLDGIRVQVLMGAGSSEGLDNRWIAKLVEAHLVRADRRGNAEWYELAHDRLIEPVRSDNERWWSEQTHVLRAARRWARNGKDKRYLYQGEQLAGVLKTVERDSAEPIVLQFLEQCEAAEEERGYKKNADRRMARLLTGMVIITGMAAFGSVYSFVFVVQHHNDLLSFIETIVSWAAVGGAVGAATLLWARRRARINQLLRGFTRKHRMDRTLQGAVDAAEEEQALDQTEDQPKWETDEPADRSAPFDAWESRVLQFAPFWIFLAIAGADGVLSRRKALALISGLKRSELCSNLRFTEIMRAVNEQREAVAAEFLDDPRSALRGFADVAHVLSTKATPEEASAFQRGMLEIARRIAAKSGREPATAAALTLVEQALQGAPVSPSRAARARYYRHSGLYTLSGVGSGLLGGTLAAVVAGAIYTPLQHVIPFQGALVVMAKVALAGFYGALVGAGVLAGISRGKVRKPRVVNCLALAGAVSAVFWRWIFFWRFIAGELTSADYRMLGMLEAPLIMVPAFLVGRMTISESFCESCLVACTPCSEKLYLQFTEREPLTRKLEEGDFSILDSLVIHLSTTRGAGQWLQLDTASCPQCKQFHTLTVEMVQAKVDRKGKQSKTSAKWIDRLLITTRRLQRLRELNPAADSAEKPPDQPARAPA